MRNLGERKMPISRILGVPDPAGSFLGLVQPFCACCTFYHILLISLTRAYRLFLRYALLHRFDCDSFCSCKHLCACFITFHAAFYNLQFAAMVVYLLLRRHYFARFYQNVSMDVPAWIARIVNYKAPWQHPVETDHVMGLCVFSGTFLNQIM